MATSIISPDHLSPDHLSGEHLSSEHLSSTAAQSEATQPENPQQFTRFPKLPLELRAAIWDLISLPRTVDIHTRQVGTLGSSETPLVEMYSPTPVPVALQVSRESRARALRCYKLCFGTLMIMEPDEGRGNSAFVHTPCTFFSYEMDVARFKCVGGLEDELPVVYLTLEDLKGIRHIRTDWCTTVSARLIRQLACFERLESFTLSWFWREMMMDGKYDDICQADVEVHASTYRPLDDRPDIAQFVSALVSARDVFAPGYRLPMLRVRSLNNHQVMDKFFSILNGLIHPGRASS